MGEMLFLSEYCGAKRTAQVFQRRDKKDYATVCYYNELHQEAYYFDSQQQAEDFAEDWVLVYDTN
jgi:hypothetical protein